MLKQLVALRPSRASSPNRNVLTTHSSVGTIVVILLFVALYLQGAISAYVFGVSQATDRTGDSSIAKALVEVMIAVLSIWLTAKRGSRAFRLPSGSYWLLAYCGWALIASVFCANTPLEAFMYVRYTLYTLIIYTAGYNSCFSIRDRRRIVGTLIALYMLQLVVTANKVFILNDRTEWRVGTITAGGGEMAAIVPLLALGFAVAYYFVLRPSLWVLVLGLSFGLIGYGSGKRAIFFTMPMFSVIFAGAVCAMQPVSRTRRMAKFAIHASLCAAVAVPIMIYGISNSTGIGATISGAEDLRDMAVRSVQYATDYENSKTSNGLMAGRRSALTRVMEDLADYPTVKKFLVGGGPATFFPKNGNSTIGSDFRPLGIGYGIVGLTRDILSLGLVGALFYCCALGVAMSAAYNAAKNLMLAQIDRTVAVGSVAGFIVLLYTYLFYGASAVTSGTISFVVFFLAGQAEFQSQNSTLQTTPSSFTNNRRCGVQKGRASIHQ